MRGIVALLLSCGALGCAGAPILPSVASGSDPKPSQRLLPSEPEARWHVAPTDSGAALELEF
jgi:hypothetical protein